MGILGRLLAKLRLAGTAPTSDCDIFAKDLVAALKEADPSLQADYDPETFSLSHDGSRTFLSNLFAEYQRAPAEDRSRLLGEHVAFIIDYGKPLPSGNAALDALLPVLRSRAALIAIHQDRTNWPHERSSRPFCDTMLLLLAIDSERSLALLTDERLAELGIGFEDALGLAVAHLDECGKHRFAELKDGLFSTACDDVYGSSRVLIPDLIEELPVIGKPVAIVVGRSNVLITGSDDDVNLARMAEFALDDFCADERAISLSPIVLTDGLWQPMAVEERHPQALKNLIQHQRAWEYDTTQKELQEVLGDDLYVATAIMIEEDGRIATATLWTSGVPTACPIVDAVILGADDEFPEITRRLDDVLQALGPFPLVDAMPYPPRLLLPGKIDPDRRRRLTAEYREHNLFPAGRG